MIPRAIECGLSPDEFWYSTDIEVHAYEKGYYNRTNTQSWMQGLYNYQAQSIALSNAFASKKSDKIEYPNHPISLFSEVKELENKIDKQKENDKRELEFRKLMMESY